jgi:hypothetical protein
MRTASGAAQWARAQQGKYGWRRLCLKFVRTAWDLPSQDATAWTEWQSIKSYNKYSNRNSALLGAPVFWRGPTSAGHVAIVVMYNKTEPIVASNDILAPGRIDLVPLSRIWSSATFVGWTRELQGRTLPLGGSWSSGIVHLSRLRPGVFDSDSIRRLQRRLNIYWYGATKTVLPITGNYDSATRTLVTKTQKHMGYTSATATDGILGPVQAKKLFGYAFRYTLIL